VPHFHVVCTLPHELGPLVLTNRKFLYALLMKTSAAALLKAAALPHPLGARIGFFGVLHTWGQKLDLHPHVHFVVPAGGLSQDQSQWIPGRRNYLVPERVLAKFFRAKFLDGLEKAYRSESLALYGPSEHLATRRAFERFLRPLRRKKWVVYAKPPFAGADAVVKYLARYTHRVAISNQRLLHLDKFGVTFGYKDYANGTENRKMTLSGPEFLRRFLLHVVPKGFVRIRYYGFLSNRNRKENLALCRTLIENAGIADRPSKLSEVPPNPGEESDRKERVCPHCKQGKMFRLEAFEPPRRFSPAVPSRAPP
jgi:hypothetical protein